jgi:hypothetical protein
MSQEELLLEVRQMPAAELEQVHREMLAAAAAAV